MARSSTPNLDVVLAWKAGQPVKWPDVNDPCNWVDDDERVGWCIAHAASGAPAELVNDYKSPEMSNVRDRTVDTKTAYEDGRVRHSNSERTARRWSWLAHRRKRSKKVRTP